MSGQRLDWDATYEIVLALRDLYPNAVLEDMSLDDLNARIVALPGFSDDPELVNDAILRAILREWYEEIGD
ncbi:MAG: Fe-S cluster assembly protein IscX [Chloroflexota bacterium]|nr:Fe-S cluster assembly protein IscX [Anaerolineaceae bacterium]MDE2819552.1 Fe-S cluster assembly protein IscX [Chloroflexota bacterium]MDE2950355.1 Fe-S cluster assembly protein IscX [Chloroflexota bacterium]